MLMLKKLNNVIVFSIYLLAQISLLFGQNFSTKITASYGKPENLISERNLRIFDDSSIKINLTSKNSDFGLNYYFSKNNIFLDEFFFKKQKKNIFFKIGKFSHIDSKKLELSSGDMIESGNSYGIPRYLIIYKNSYRKINLTLSLSDGILDKNSINIQRPYYHDKRLNIEYNGFSLGLTHNVIWGGNVTGYGKQPSDLDDYLKIFFNQGGGADAVETDKPNRLGDAFGSWNFTYHKLVKNLSLYTYHQFYFEDNSGLKFKNQMNKFDGLSGISIATSNFQLLFERIKTSNQGGPVHPPGRDGYYWNGIYRNGWQYKNRVIGNIYITPTKNRVKIYHYGLMRKFRNTSIIAIYSTGKIYNISYNGGIPAEYEKDFSLNDFDYHQQSSLAYEIDISNLKLRFTAENNFNNGYNYFLTTEYSF